MRSISNRRASSLDGGDFNDEILLRPRIVECLTKASERRIVLVAAAPGCGKSVAVRQFLAGRSKDAIHIDACAFEASMVPKTFTGTVAIDGFERVNPASAAAIVSRIESANAKTRWIITTRTVAELPFGTWMARRDCELPIGIPDLRFTESEAAQACARAGVSLEPDDVRDLLAFTDGWAVAIAIAIRALHHGMAKRDVRTVVRDAVTAYLREQVYSGFSASERELLDVASALPDIDVDILQSAGFPEALQVLESIRTRTGLMCEDDRGFTAPRPIKEFFQRETALGGSRRSTEVNLRAARALESSGRMEGALVAYGAAGSQPDLLRILERSGFDLLERGRAEAVSDAVEALDENTRRSNPRILALRGVLQSLAGKPIRAEAMLRRAISQAKNDRDLLGFASLRMAPLTANYGGNAEETLQPLAADKMQQPAVRAEALSLLAVSYSMSGDKVAASRATEEAQKLLVDIEIESTRAKTLQRIGVAAMYTGEDEKARQALVQAGDLANELELNGVASRSWSALSNLMCHAYDDVMAQLWYAERAAEAAIKSGDALELQTALLQVLAAEMRRGNAEESSSLEDQLTSIKSDPQRAYLMATFKALRFAWDGKFAQAHECLSTCWNRMYHQFDRILCGAECALFLALDERRDASIRLIERVIPLADVTKPEGLFSARCVALAVLCCAVAEMVNRRLTAARKLSRRLRRSRDSVVILASRISDHYTMDGVLTDNEIAVAYDRLSELGYADVVKVLEAVSRSFGPRQYEGNASLTPSEVSVLQSLSEGLTPKEIAARDGRSFNTVRNHIANASAKLKCRTRTQVLTAARRLKIIS